MEYCVSIFSVCVLCGSCVRILAYIYNVCAVSYVRIFSVCLLYEFCMTIFSEWVLNCNIMAEGFRFIPLGLVGLRTFRLGAWVDWVQTWVQVLTRSRGGCVVHRCQNKNPIERLTSGCEWRHAPEARVRRIWWILKKSVSGVVTCLRRRRLSFACSRRPWAGVARDGGGQMKKPE